MKLCLHSVLSLSFTHTNTRVHMRMLVYLMYVLYLNLFSVISTRCILTIHIKVLCYTGVIIIIVIWQNTESLILAHSYRHWRLLLLSFFIIIINYYSRSRESRTFLAIITLRSNILKFKLQIERFDFRRSHSNIFNRWFLSKG